MCDEETKGEPEVLPSEVDCTDCKFRFPVTAAWVLPPHPTNTTCSYVCESCAVKREIACSTCRCFLQTADREWYFRRERRCVECKRVSCETCAQSWTCFFPDERKRDAKPVAGDPKYYCPDCTKKAIDDSYNNRSRTRSCPSFLSCIFGK